jgi:uncharacterized protein DUF1360
MTLDLFLRIYAASAILILLMVDLAFPLGPVRRWLNAGPHVGAASEQGPWFVVGGPHEGGPYDSPQKAAVQLTTAQRVRAWGGELTSCPWCFGGWATLVASLAFIDAGWMVRLSWWPLVWLAASSTVVVLDAIAES